MNFNEVTYLGFALPDELQNELIALDSSPHFATFNFSWSLIRALRCVCKKVNIISTQEVRNYPAVDKIIFRKANYYTRDFNVQVIGFINLIFLKHVTRTLQLFLRPSFYHAILRSEFLVVHGTHTPYLLFAIFFRLFGKKCLLVLTDKHGIEVSSDKRIGVILRNIDTILMNYLVNHFDWHFVLSAEFLKVHKLKKCLVQPGILSSAFLTNIDAANRTCDSSGAFNVVFAGGLSKLNGVDLLLASISYVEDKEFRFEFIGSGELVETIIESSARDPRIIYRGVLDDAKLAVALVSANLLINPKPSTFEYSQISFPSKLIEYMATGVAILTTRLLCIPNDLDDCFLYIDEECPESIARSIVGAKELSIESRTAVALRALKRVKGLYSESAVGNKVAELIIESTYI